MTESPFDSVETGTLTVEDGSWGQIAALFDESLEVQRIEVIIGSETLEIEPLAEPIEITKRVTEE